MPIRKTALREASGVKLVQVEQITPSGRVTQTHYRLSTLRPHQPRLIADETEAQSAFDLEVIASLADGAVQNILKAH